MKTSLGTKKVVYTVMSFRCNLSLYIYIYIYIIFPPLKDMLRMAWSLLIYVTLWSVGTVSPRFRRSTSACIREAVSVR